MAFPELLDTVTLVLLGALPLSVMVQLKPVGGVTLPGEQLRFVSDTVTGWLMVMEVPPPLMGIPVPLPSEADALLLIADKVLDVVDEITKVTEASDPSVIAVVLKPATMHRTSPDEGLLQLTDLPALEALEPVDQKVPEAGLKSPGAYSRSN